MLTEQGLIFVADLILAGVSEAVVVIGDGQAILAERAPDEGFPRLSEDGQTLVFQATFGPEEANGEWRGEGLRVGDNVVEWEDKDSGRKVLGATWTVEISINLAA